MHKAIAKPDIYPLYASIHDQFLGNTEANMRKMWVFSEITDPETAHKLPYPIALKTLTFAPGTK
jgi:hypothetical protein